jgi:hypothetical protein
MARTRAKKPRHKLRRNIDAVGQKNADLNLREAPNICLFSLTRGATPRTYRVFGEEARARLHILY